MAPQPLGARLWVGLCLVVGLVGAAPAAAQVISGNITNASGGVGIQNVNVVLLNSSGQQVNQSGPSAITTGFYSFSVSPGSYYIKTSNSSGFIDQIVGPSGNINCVGCVVQNFGSVTTPGALQNVNANRTVNFALSAGGRISGTLAKPGVTAPSALLSGINVSVYTSTGVQVSGFTQTNTSGVYTTGPGLTTGNYYIKTQNVSGFVDAVYNSELLNTTANCLNCTVTSAGSAIPVTLGNTTPTINLTLQAGGAISGRVTLADGVTGVGNVSVNFYNSSGTLVGNAQSNNQGTVGNYSSSGLPTGDYFVATTNNSAGLVNELFDNKQITNSNPTTAFITGNGTPVSVAVGSASTANFLLALGATITGTITNASTSASIQNVSVLITDASNAFIKSGSTNGSGVFTIDGLADGTYYVKTTNGGTLGGYIDQAYNGKSCAGGFCNPSQVGATAFTLGAGQTQSGVDFALQVGGRISGTVTADGGGAIAGVTVQAYDASSQFGQSLGSATTAADGTYTISGLGTLTYAVKTSNSAGYIDELYNNIPCSSCNITAGQGVAVTLGNTSSGINFSLVAGGRITGTVTNAVTGLPGSGVNVSFYNSSGASVGSATTNGSGVYTSSGLPSGTYFVVTQVFNSAFINKLYNNIVCLGCTNPGPPGTPAGVVNGTPVNVTVGSATTGIDFALAPGAQISGTVKTAGGTGINNASVQIYTLASGTSSVTSTGTGNNGTGAYSTSGLPPGSYYAKTNTSGPNSPGTIDQVWKQAGGVTCTSSCKASDFGDAIALTDTSSSVSGINFNLASGGTIKGRVTNASSGNGIGSLQLMAFDVNNLNSGSVASTNSTADGTYTLSGLATGSYYVKTSAPQGSPLINQVYNGVTCVNCSASIGQSVPVTAGQDQTGIDFALASGGTITGTVRNANGGTPLSGINVSLSTAATSFAGSAQTNGSGVFTIAGLPAGTYFARSSNTQGFIDKIYNDIVCQTCFGSSANGTPIAVQVGVTASGIDFNLVRGGRISGTVIDAVSGNPIVATSVGIFNGTGAQVSTGLTNDAGAYTSDVGLPTGTYFAKTFSTSSSGSGYINELYNNIACVNCPPSSGQGIAVTAGATTANINFSLAPGGRITGTITDASANPIQGVTVRIYNSQADAQTQQPTQLGSGFSGPNGAYAVTGLPGGTFVASTSNSLGYVDEIYDDVKCATCGITAGKTFEVSVGNTTSGIDFSLDRGAKITGTVQNANGALLSGVGIGIYNAQNQQVANTSTNQLGIYTTGGLKPGQYFVRTTFAQGYVNQLYDALPCAPCTPANGTAVTLTGTDTASGVNFTLQTGGSISGTITQAGGSGNGAVANAPGDGISGIQVSVFDAGNSFIAGAQTGSDGTFKVTGLAAGTYFAKTSNQRGFIDTMYDGIACVYCSLSAGKPIVVDGNGDTANINFVMSAGGSVSGIVTDPASAPLASVTVELYGAAGQFLRTGATDGLGHYRLGGLADGTYYLKTRNSVGYIDKLYNDVTCSSCNPAGGMPVKITAASNATGIDFSLPVGGFVAGTVTSAGGTPLENISVSVFTDRGGSPVAQGFTNANGGYKTSGLPSGTYFVKTNNNRGFIDQLYDGKSCSFCNTTTGTPVVVTTGQATTGINFSLPLGGKVSGTVTAGGAGVPGVSVTFVTASGQTAANGQTDGTGHYVTFGGLGTGTYYARTFNSSGLVDEIYDDVACASCAPGTGKPISVTIGQETTGIDFSLLAGSRIAGLILDESTQKPIPNAQVEVFASDGYFATFASTGSSGQYITNSGLKAGTYYVRATSTQGHIAKMYNNLVCPACSPLTGTPIVLAAAETKTGVDFSLAPGGLIAGTVRDAVTGAPIGAINQAFLDVQIFNQNNNLVATGHVDPSGRYRAGSGLPSGTYFARTINNQGLINKLYNNTVCLGESGPGKAGGGLLAPACLPNSGAPITVVTGQTTSGIDFSLAVGARIGGTVTDAATGVPLSSIGVAIFDSNGKMVTGGRTDNAGKYLSIGGVPPGTYFAIANGFDSGYSPTLYENTTCLACNPTMGTPISVYTSRGDIHFQLSRGGSFSGIVKSKTSGQGLGNVKLSLYSAAGSLLGSGVTDGSGEFMAAGIPAGTYFMRTFNVLGFVDQSFEQHPCAPCPIPDATPIVITAGGQVSGIDFVLEDGGLVKGTVTDATSGAPLQGVTVAFYLPDGTTFVGRSEASDANGYYAISLPVGTYVVQADPVQGYTPVATQASAFGNGGRVNAGSGVVTVTQGGESTVTFPLESCSAPTVSPGTLGVLSLGTPFSTTLVATGSNGPYVFSVADGNLPPGLALDASTGALSGTPTARGTANFTIAATGTTSCAGTTTYAQVTRGVTLDGTGVSLSGDGGSGTVGVIAEASDVAWTATSSASWITLAGSNVGTGNGTVSYVVAQNTGAARTGTITVAGEAFAITQTQPSRPRMSMDAPTSSQALARSFLVSGWALDLDASSGSGVDAVHVYAYPIVDGVLGSGTFLGAASATARSDVANFYGQQFLDSGFSLSVSDLPVGSYRVVSMARSVVTGRFDASQSADVTVTAPDANPVGVLDSPTANATVGASFTVSGWAVDLGASSGVGIDAVHVWAYPIIGDSLGTPTLLGAATVGGSRPDVGAVLGAQFTASGFSLEASGLSAGRYRIAAFARSTVSGDFSSARLSDITVDVPIPNPVMFIDGPADGSVQSQPFLIVGWAADLGARSGTGVDAIHVWAFNVDTGGSTFVGVASYGGTRLDVGAVVGTQFDNTGFSVSVADLPAGTYDIEVYVHSSLVGTFNQAKGVRITVQ